MYDSVFVIVCRLTGYVMALPCSTTITSSEVDSLFLTRFVTFFGLPKEIFSDVDEILMQIFSPHSVRSQELSSIDPLCIVRRVMVGLSGQYR